MNYRLVFTVFLMLFIALSGCKKANTEIVPENSEEIGQTNPAEKDRYEYRDLFSVYDSQSKQYSKVDLNGDGLVDVNFVTGGSYGSGGGSSWTALCFLDTTWKICVKTYTALESCSFGSTVRMQKLASSLIIGDSIFSNAAVGSSTEFLYLDKNSGSMPSYCQPYVFSPFSIYSPNYADNYVGFRRIVNSKVQISWLKFRNSDKGWQLLEMLKFREEDFVIVGK